MIKTNFLNPQIVKVDYALAGWVSIVTTQGGVVFLFGKNWVNIYTSNGKCKHDQKSKKKDGCDFYETSINGFIPGELTDHLLELDKCSQLPVILRLTYASGNVVIVGSKHNPAEFSMSYSSSNGGTAFEASLESLRPCPILRPL